MSVTLRACPNCQSRDVVKNDRTRHGKQNYKCRNCGRQFVEAPQWRMILEETKGIIDRMSVGETAIGKHCPRSADF